MDIYSIYSNISRTKFLRIKCLFIKPISDIVFSKHILFVLQTCFKFVKHWADIPLSLFWEPLLFLWRPDNTSNNMLFSTSWGIYFGLAWPPTSEIQFIACIQTWSSAFYWVMWETSMLPSKRTPPIVCLLWWVPDCLTLEFSTLIAAIPMIYKARIGSCAMQWMC